MTIERIRTFIFGGKFFYYCFLFTVILFLLPFPIYLVAMYGGYLPDRDEWFSHSNHGPWRWELPGLFIVMPLLILSVFTLVSGTIYFLVRKRFSDILRLIFLLLTQVLLLRIQAYYLFWTVD